MLTPSYRIMMLDEGGLWAYTIIAGNVFVDDVRRALLSEGHTDKTAEDYIEKWLRAPAQYYLDNWAPDE
jgi:hypothetical protein